MSPYSNLFDQEESDTSRPDRVISKVNMSAVDIGPEPNMAHKLRSVSFTVSTFLLVLAILPFALPFMLIFRIYRTVLANIIQKQEGDRVSMVSGDDSVWLQDSPENRAIINGLWQFKGSPDVDKITTVINERLVTAKDPHNPSAKLFPKITRYATKILHRYVWFEDPHFDMKGHVYIHPVPAPNNKTDLERMVGELCSAPMPIHKPAWQFIFLNPAEGDPNHGKMHYGVFRAHHSIADGVSLIRIIMQKLVDEKPKRTKSSIRFGARNLMKMASRAVFEGPALLVSRLLRPRDNNIIHGPELSGTKLVSWSDAIDLDLIKQIKNATDTTVNDVIISCLASTFREYFKVNASEIPQGLLAYIPVDIRSASADITLDNQFALVFLDLPLDEDDQLKTLKKTKHRMDAIKQSPEPVVNAYTINYCMNRLPNWLTQMFFDWVAQKSSLIVSNVPGPQEKLKLAGNEIDAMVFWPPQKTNVGLGASIFTYCDTLRLGIYVDKSILSNPRQLVNGFTRNINKLLDSISKQQ